MPSHPGSSTRSPSPFLAAPDTLRPCLRPSPTLLPLLGPLRPRLSVSAHALGGLRRPSGRAAPGDLSVRPHPAPPCWAPPALLRGWGYCLRKNWRTSGISAVVKLVSSANHKVLWVWPETPFPAPTPNSVSGPLCLSSSYLALQGGGRAARVSSLCTVTMETQAGRPGGAGWQTDGRAGWRCCGALLWPGPVEESGIHWPCGRWGFPCRFTGDPFFCRRLSVPGSGREVMRVNCACSRGRVSDVFISILWGLAKRVVLSWNSIVSVEWESDRQRDFV